MGALDFEFNIKGLSCSLSMVLRPCPLTARISPN